MTSPWYSSFEGSAPTYGYTLAVAAILIIATFVLYRQRVEVLRQKFTAAGESFEGSLRACAKISAYMDHHEEPGFAILRVCAKSLLFLGLMQWHYHVGFLVMLVLLVVESSLDTFRILLAYWNCERLDSVSVIADDEAHELRADATKINPTNVYEDLTKPRSIAILVFLTQVILIGLVMDDSYRTTTRACFSGQGNTCPVLTSLGSYCLYLLGTFMTCVFYVGPRNSYGKKEQNPTFWLKLFLLTKEKSTLTFTWHDQAADQQRTFIILDENDTNGGRYTTKRASIWLRFIMSYLVNGAGFVFLLHVLPVQVAGQANAIGIVFRAVGMIYLVDLDDTVGNEMTLVDPNAGASGDTLGTSVNTGFLSTFSRLREKLSTRLSSGNEDVANEGTGLLS